MSYVKAFLSEYEEMGNKFDYKDYESIPTFIREIIEDEADVRNFSKVPLAEINWMLNDLFEEMNYNNQPESIGVYDE